MILPHTNPFKIQQRLATTDRRSSRFYRNADSVVEQVSVERIAALFFYRVRELNIAAAG